MITTVLCAILIGASLCYGIHCSSRDGNDYLRLFNETINAIKFIPVFIKVYLIGIFETVVITLWQRGIFGGYSRRDNIYNVKKIISSNAIQNGSRLAIVTGGDSGIGLEIVCGLLQAGYRVIIASRENTLSQYAKDRILQAVNDLDRVQYQSMDLASFSSVRGFASTLQKNLRRGEIDLLINNAGVMNVEHHVTVDKLESQFQINCLSPLLLSTLLLPWMNVQTGSKILFASSSTLYAVHKLDLDMAKKSYGWDGLTHYAHSKLAVAISTLCLGNMLDKYTDKIKVYCFHPGTVRTGLFSHTTIFGLPLLSYIFDFIMLSPEEGCRTPLYLALSPCLKAKNGEFWANCTPHPLPQICKLKMTENLQGDIWEKLLDYCYLRQSDVEGALKSIQSKDV